MKYIKIFFAMLLMAFSFSSCLESGLEELDTYEGNDITAGFAFYRYIDTSTTMNVSGEYAVKQKQLTRVNQTIDVDAATCDLTFAVPSNFTDAEKADVNINKLVIVTQISSAAVMEPVDNSPSLGVPADWSTPHKYKVTAANGTSKIWTITVTLNK
jgi:hypothetical protein